MKTWKEYVSERKKPTFRSAQKAKKGDLGEDYSGEIGKVLAVEPINNWNKLNKYDRSRWMDEDSIEEFKSMGTTHLIAVKMDNQNETAVYVYGDDGFRVYKSVDGIPANRK